MRPSANDALREQLHEMRNRRIDEIRQAKERRARLTPMAAARGTILLVTVTTARGLILSRQTVQAGPNSKALQKMPQTPVMAGPAARNGETTLAVPLKTTYHTGAKRKLKLGAARVLPRPRAAQGYALLNRKAFRKLNKKYDKAVNARPPYRFMNEK